MLKSLHLNNCEFVYMQKSNIVKFYQKTKKCMKSPLALINDIRKRRINPVP